MGKAARARREQHSVRVNLEQLRVHALLGRTVELDVDPADGWRVGELVKLWPYRGLVRMATPQRITVDFDPLPGEVPPPSLDESP